MSYFYLYLVFVFAFWNISVQDRDNKSNSATPISFENILSKFHQNDYKITFERTELIRFDAKFVKMQLRTFKYNRTSAVINASLTLTVDMGYDVEVIGQTYKFASNEYRLFPLRCQVNVCAAIASKAMGFDKLSKFGNLVCPLVKDKNYHFYNWSPDELHLPPFIPAGQYMVESQYMYNFSEIFTLKNFGIVHRPIVIPD